MLKKLFKKISMALLCLSLLIFNSAPVLASENISYNTKTVSIANISINELVDGGSCTQTIAAGAMGVFNVTVSDFDLRNITVSSSVPVKTLIRPVPAVYQDYISFDSGNSRMFNMIGWHFIPGMQYNVFVIPEATADVTVNMSKATSVLSWVNMGRDTIVEKNLLQSQQLEQYGLAFKTSGTYRITVKAAGKLFATFADGYDSSQSKVVTLDGNTYVFDNLKINATGDMQNSYGLILTSYDPQNSGSTYTVTIEKIN